MKSRRSRWMQDKRGAHIPTKNSSVSPEDQGIDRFGAGASRPLRSSQFDRYDRFHPTDPYEDLAKPHTGIENRTRVVNRRPIGETMPDIGDARHNDEPASQMAEAVQAEEQGWLASLLAILPLTREESHKILSWWGRITGHIPSSSASVDKRGHTGNTLSQVASLLLVYLMTFLVMAGLVYGGLLLAHRLWSPCMNTAQTCLPQQAPLSPSASASPASHSRYPALPALGTPSASPTGNALIATPVSGGLPADPPIPTLCPDGATPTPGATCTPCDWHGWRWTRQPEPTTATISQALLNAAHTYHLPPRLLGAVSVRESHWQENIISCSYDAGLMQIKVAYWRSLALHVVPACGLSAIYESPWSLQGNADLSAKLLAWIRCYFEFAGDAGGTLTNPGAYTSGWYYAQAHLPYPDTSLARGYCQTTYQTHATYQALGASGAIAGFSCPYTPSLKDWTLLDITISAYNEGMGTLVSQGIQNWAVYVRPIEASLASCMTSPKSANQLQQAICGLPPQSP